MMFPETKLTVELVPRTAWWSNVRSEVAPEVWDRIKREVGQKAGRRCEICGGRGPKWPVEAHERWHYDDKTRIQRLVGIQALCPDCHSVKHAGYSSASGKGSHVLRHLAKVNGWSVADASMYLEVVFEVWMRRSSHEWRLDISHLAQYGVEGVEGLITRPPTT